MAALLILWVLVGFPHRYLDGYQQMLLILACFASLYPEKRKTSK